MRALLLASILAVVLAVPVSAAPDQGSIQLVSDGSPSYGEFVSFTGTAPTRVGNPFVYLRCEQDGELVAHGYHRLVNDVTQGEFGLYSPTWTGGAATCTGSIADVSTHNTKLYASVTFEVAG
jgi:hypothetical protein